MVKKNKKKKKDETKITNAYFRRETLEARNFAIIDNPMPKRIEYANIKAKPAFSKGLRKTSSKRILEKENKVILPRASLTPFDNISTKTENIRKYLKSELFFLLNIESKHTAPGMNPII